MGSFKTRRKQSKFKQILKNDLGIDLIEEPSKNLMISNAGLVSGVKYEEIAQLFTRYGSVEKIVMIPNKSYSFITYSKIEEAVEASHSVNGRMQIGSMDGPLYLFYTTSVPSGMDFLSSKTLPEGLTLLEDFVTKEEEGKLLNCVDWTHCNDETGKVLKHRRVKHYGYEFRYDINNVDKDCPLTELIPEECGFVRGRLERLGHALPWEPNQLTVNQYQRGQGIPSHVDTHSAFESPLLSLSLGSDVVMEFRLGSQHVPVLLPRRSLLIMDKQARYCWSHGITPRTMDVVSLPQDGGLSVRERGCRTSFTLRRVRPGPCDCQYPAHCDSQKPACAISAQQASQLEQLYVHNVYNNIACHFSETRTKVWPNVKEFLRSFPAGSLLLDAGCGNGKYFGVNPDIFHVGFDRSSGLADITSSRGYEVFVSDCLQLPLRDDVADGVISVAVLHHLSTRERRVQALREMHRALVPGGRALVTVWAKDQTKQRMTAYLKQDRKNRRKLDTSEKFTTVQDVKVLPEMTDKSSRSSEYKLPVHVPRTEFEHQDVFVPWKVKWKDITIKEKEVFLRYYHVFEENELLELCTGLEKVKVLNTYYTEGNWCIIFEKHNNS